MDDGTHNWSHAAWRVWLSRHQAALLLLARQYLASAAEAQDAVQDGFVRFWQNRHRAADQPAYLFACVRSAALDLRRSHLARKKRETIAGTSAAEDALLTGPPELDERRRIIQTALAQLPVEQREVVVLKIWSELTFAQIAAALEIPANTAASRYRYAMERLQKLLLPEVTHE